MALQTDDYSVNGRRLTKLLQPLSSQDPVVAEGLRLLKEWNYFTSADSAGDLLPTIAIIPFASRDAVNDGDMFGEVLAEELITTFHARRT
jgi:hypothetical protein